MQPPSNRAVVEAFFEALERLDWDAALALMDDAIVYQNVPFPPDRGKRRVARTLKTFARVVREFEVVMHHIAEEGDTVLTERTDSLRGPVLDLEFWVCGTFELKDSKIVLWRDYFDVAGLGLQLLTSPLRKLRRRAGLSASR